MKTLWATRNMIETTTMAHARFAKFLNVQKIEELDSRLLYVDKGITGGFWVGNKDYEMYAYLQPEIMYTVKDVLNALDIANDKNFIEIVNRIYKENIKEYNKIKQERFKTGQKVIKILKANDEKSELIKREFIESGLDTHDDSDLIMPFVFIYMNEFNIENYRIPYLGYVEPYYYLNGITTIWNYDSEDFYKIIYFVISKNVSSNAFFNKILYEVETAYYNLNMNMPFDNKKLFYHHIYKAIFSLSLFYDKNNLKFYLDYSKKQVLDILEPHKYNFFTKNKVQLKHITYDTVRSDYVLINTNTLRKKYMI